MREWDVGAADLAEDAAREFAVGEEQWPLKGFVVRYDGDLYAWLNRCPHAGHALNLDPDDFFAPEASLLRCMSHGARFEPDSGLCVSGPCTGNSLTPLQCREEGGRIIVLAPVSMRKLQELNS